MRRHHLDREIGSEDNSMEKMPEGSKELEFEGEGFQCGFSPVSKEGRGR